MDIEHNTDSTISVVDMTRGAGWILDGFGYFSKSAIAWIVTIILFFIINIVMSLVPVLGSIAAQILMSVFIGGIIVGCHAQANGGIFTVNHLFAGFSQHTVQLVVLGIYYTLGVILIAVAIIAFVFVLPGSDVFMEQIHAGDIDSLRNAIRTLMLLILFGSALYIPLLMAYWFAPALVVLEGMSPLTAMQKSFTGCLHNILPFLVYGIVGFIFCIIAAIPFMLGFLVLIPALLASNYVAYREIFTRK